MAERPWVVLAGLMGLALGGWLGRQTAARPPLPPAPTPCPERGDCQLQEDRIARLEAALAELRMRSEQAEQRVAATRAGYRALAARTEGQPAAWEEARVPIPAHQGAVGFRPALEEALVACGIDGTVLESDCGEPPCVALLSGPGPGWRGRLGDCAAWTESFGEELIETGVVLPCGGPAVSAIASPSVFDFVPRPEDAGPANDVRRLQTRAQELAELIDCQ